MTSIDNIHIMCANELCPGILFYKFQDSISILKLDFLGGATLRKIYDPGIVDPFQFFDKDIFNRNNLIKLGIFSDGVMVDKVLFQVQKIKLLKLHQVIEMLSISNMGSRIAIEIAKMIAGIKYSDYAMTKKFFEMF